jgi:DNA primase
MDAVEEIKERLNIEDVIGTYVELKRAGRNFKGLSPFGSERTPSFVVSPEKQIWHDFSSGKGGNMFSFVMEMEGLDFRGALELLARRAGVDLEQYSSSHSKTNAKLKERLYELLEVATRFYQVQFSKNQGALEYVLRQRQFSKATALDWQIGYAPNGGTALIDFLKAKKFTDDEIKRAGLSAQRYRGIGDMFRGRIMIPLADPQGRIIGFTARILDDDPNAPKYINTPQTLLYDKSRHVFGLHLAKEAIRRSNYAVVSEGNLDVIASYQAGVKQVFATAGTAMTEQHLKALSSFTNDIRLAFDADKAGVAATERALPIASRVGIALSIVTIDSGKDPDELIKQDPSRWKEIIEKPQYAPDWLMSRYEKLLDLTSAQGKKEFSNVIMRVVSGFADPVEREHYVAEISAIIGVSREALLTKLQSGKTAAPKKRPSVQDHKALDKATIEIIKAQDRFLSLMLRQPKLRDFLQQLLTDMFADGSARQLFTFIQTHPDFAGTEDAKELQKFSEYAKIIVLQYEELYSDLEFIELRYEAARLQARLIEQYVKSQKQTLTEQLHTADEAATDMLLNRAKKLDALLKQAKEA